MPRRKDVEGMKLAAVAGDSDDAVNKATEEAAALRRAEGGPVVLRYRNNQSVVEPATPPKPLPETPTPMPEPSGNELLQPLPDNQQPGAAQESVPQSQHTVPRPPQADEPAAQPQHVVPRPPQSQSQPPQDSQPVANPNGGLLMPLPDNQQPPAAQNPPQ